MSCSCWVCMWQAQSSCWGSLCWQRGGVFSERFLHEDTHALRVFCFCFVAEKWAIPEESGGRDLEIWNAPYRNKKLLGAPGIAARSILATRNKKPFKTHPVLQFFSESTWHQHPGGTFGRWWRTCAALRPETNPCRSEPVSS